jgi:hypothetical protein
MELAASICSTPITILGLIDCDRQGFKSKVEVCLQQTSRAVAFPLTPFCSVICSSFQMLYRTNAFPMRLKATLGHGFRARLGSARIQTSATRRLPVLS